jgi:transcriptional regulator of acetoin/glycerol metabolism
MDVPGVVDRLSTHTEEAAIVNLAMSHGATTLNDTSDDAPRRRSARPGAVVLFTAGAPRAQALELPRGGLELGRELPRGLFEQDDRVSRLHVRITRNGAGFEVEDLGSRNGTFVNGERVGEKSLAKSGSVLRLGRSLVWLVDDIGVYQRAHDLDVREGPVIGGMLARAFAELRLASKGGDPLCLRGESGAGKELAARAFHEAKFGHDPKAPFVAVNCAAIPEGLSERLLFGARRGAYSGAVTDTEGYVQSAHGGTLFLDEIAELDPLVQAKLLRVLETREVLQLGAVKPRKVEIQICVASHKSLRDEVTQGRFREDLYFRVGRPEVYIPPLRERLDELAWLMARELTAVHAELRASVNLLEACALRVWPGNVREFLREIRRAAHQALAAELHLVDTQHLAHDAGHGLSAGKPGEGSASKSVLPSDERIASALVENGGNVRGTARALGIHRNQLRRWIERNQPGAVVTDGLEDES